MKVEWTAPILWTLLLAIVLVATGPWVRRHYRSTTPSPEAAVRRRLVLLRVATIVLLLLGAGGAILVLERTDIRPARVVVLVDDSASMAIGDGPDGVTRWEEALAVSAAVESTLTARDLDVDFAMLRGDGLSLPRPLDDPDDPPAAEGSSLDGLLRGGLSGAPPSLLVLISDGHETRAAPGAGAAAVVVAGVGDPTGPPDIDLTGIAVPEVAHVGDEVAVELTLGVRRADGPSLAGVDSLTVVLEADGVEVDRGTIAASEDDAIVRLELRDRPEEPGLRLLTARLAPSAGETNLGNNILSAALEVREGRRDVLVLTSRPGWFNRFLARSVHGEERLELDVAAPSADGPAFVDGGAWTPPIAADAWTRWNAVVLADPGAAAWFDPAPLVAAVRSGLGLVLVDPAEGAGWTGPLGDLQPVTSNGRPVPGNWLFGTAPGAASHPVFDGIPGAAEAFADAPPLTRLRPVTARPEARVLLQGRQGTDADVAGLPLLATAPAGAGRSAWLGTPDIWRQAFWRPASSPPEAAEATLAVLRNLMLWAAGGEDEAGVTLLGRRNLYHDGERIDVKARRLDLRGLPVDPPGRLEVRSADDPSAPPVIHTMHPVPGEPGTSRAEIGPLSPGRHVLRPVGGTDGEPMGDPREIVVVSESPEVRQDTQDRRRLRALAETAGGRYVDLGRRTGRSALLRSVAEFDAAPSATIQRGALHPWSTWIFFGAVVSLLATEWILRRRHGLL